METFWKVDTEHSLVHSSLLNCTYLEESNVTTGDLRPLRTWTSPGPLPESQHPPCSDTPSLPLLSKQQPAGSHQVATKHVLT